MATVQELRAMLTTHQANIEARNALMKVQASEAILLSEDVQIDWRDVCRILEDILVSISKEGQLRSSKVSDALPIVDLALATLTKSANAAENRLQRSHISWWDRCLALLPGTSGNRARHIIRSYEYDHAELNRLKDVLSSVRVYREKIAEALDEAIHRHLMLESEEYRTLFAEGANYAADKEMAINLSSRLTRFTTQTVEAAVDFYELHGLKPELPAVDYKFKQNRELLKMGIDRFAETARARSELADARMRAMRDRLKAEIYTRSASPQKP